MKEALGSCSHQIIKCINFILAIFLTALLYTQENLEPFCSALRHVYQEQSFQILSIPLSSHQAKYLTCYMVTLF